ncbi:MAG: S-layer protein domain-containing protein [Methanosarcina sp.]|uniref:S-layer protein domain-containing protein n=1 Tax=Methanosarcina sp. TaxID=2213 RepID=UPI002623B9BF|nr:S-layer protein domain-containing protein [Methanosarcina sp.]MDD3246698.1 S-layer protein domain-containing protein [Methanosarcina sp.]
MKKASLQIFTAILVLGLFCGTATAVPVISGDVTPSQNSTVTGTVGAPQVFTVPLNETANVIWTENGTATTITTDASNISTLSHVIQLGSYQVIAAVEGTGETVTWNVAGTAGVPVITLSDPSSSSVSNNVGESRTFTATVSQTSNMTWALDGVTLYTNSSVDSSSYTNSSAVAGTHTIKVDASNVNGNAESKSWTWTVGTTGVPVTVDPSEGTIEVAQGGSKTFYVNSTNGQNVNVDWRVNDVSTKTETGVTSSSYEFKGDTTGEYNLKAVITDPNGVYASSTKTWTVKVQSKYYSSGNRIWDESLGMATTYTWTAQSYSGFYYDLDTGVSSEEMTITDIGRNINDGDIEYSTKPTETEFEYGTWGSYQVIGFMADKYFAGYSDNTSVSGVDDVSLISDGILAKILIDNDDKESAYSGDALVLEDGYSLNIVEVDVNGNTVWVQLEKDGDVVDDDFITSGQDYTYETELGEAEDVPIIIAHFGTVFAGAETSAVFIQGLFQVSDNYVELSNGDSYGEMEVTSLSSSEIKMKNEDDISLDKGDTIDLMGKIQIQVADDNTLRFAPVLDTTEEGTYELRGTVYDEDDDGDSLPTWTPFNFEGFYYNIDEGIGTEQLKIEELNDREIPSGKLVYQSSPQPVEFEHDEWGNFTVVGFMAEKYFAGYPDDTADGKINDVSVLSDNVLAKVLTDSDDKESMYSGSALVLEEGYSLNILEVDVNGETVWVQLEKDGDVVDDDFITSGQDYIYETELGEAEDVPIIIVHFGTVFAGAETSAVFTQGIFQISDDYIEINNGDVFDEMEISTVSESGITMKNDDDIGLGDDDTIDIMGDIKFKTADSNTLRFYPFVEVDSEGGASKALKINLPDEIIVGDTFEIEVTAGNESIEGVTVNFNAVSAGKTDADGIIEYTAEEEGTFKVTAEKDGYTTANTNAKVIPPKEKMSLNISPETVYVGDTITIETLKTIGGDPIEGANISIDSKALGKTNSNGTITFTTEEIGKIKISATLEGFLDKSVDVNVKDYEAIFEFSNLVIDPIEVRAEKEATITIDAENTGNAAGNYSVELVVNGSSVDSQQISLDVGESTTVTFEHSEEVPGTYTVEVGGQEATYTVKEKSSLLIYALITIILLLGGGIAYMFTKGGWTMAMLQAKVDELIKSANLKK